MTKSGILLVGSLNPDKSCQDRVRVISSYGFCPSLRATDYKDPQKICVGVNFENRTICFM